MTEIIERLLPWILAVGLLAVGIGYLIGTVRKAKGEARQDLLTIAASERDVWRDRSQRLEGELAEQRQRHELQMRNATEKIARLEGVVEQQRAEMDGLRRLVMFETVPPAMQALLEQVAGTAVDAIVERLRPSIGDGAE